MAGFHDFLRARLDDARGAAAARPAPQPEPSADAEEPDESWTNDSIRDWLDEQGIEYHASDTKAELLDRI